MYATGQLGAVGYNDAEYIGGTPWDVFLQEESFCRPFPLGPALTPLHTHGGCKWALQVIMHTLIVPLRQSTRLTRSQRLGQRKNKDQYRRAPMTMQTVQQGSWPSRACAPLRLPEHIAHLQLDSLYACI